MILLQILLLLLNIAAVVLLVILVLRKQCGENFGKGWMGVGAGMHYPLYGMKKPKQAGLEAPMYVECGSDCQGFANSGQATPQAFWSQSSGPDSCGTCLTGYGFGEEPCQGDFSGLESTAGTSDQSNFKGEFCSAYTQVKGCAAGSPGWQAANSVMKCS